MAWHPIYEDANKRVDRDDETGEQRTVYANPHEETLRTQARDALAANRLFLQDASVTQAEAVAQVKALTRQVQALIRFELDDLTGTD